jgi:hypothetical protein
MGLGNSINLSEAPALFFANARSRIVSLKGGEEKALQALDHPDPAVLNFTRRAMAVTLTISAVSRSLPMCRATNCMPQRPMPAVAAAHCR